MMCGVSIVRRLQKTVWRNSAIDKTKGVHAASRKSIFSSKVLISYGWLILNLVLFTGTAPPALAIAQTHGSQAIDQAVSFSPRRPLLAHVRFCLVYTGQCDVRHDRRDPALATQEHLNEILQVNRAVNRAITPKADEGFDTWDIDVTEGDCEDYALQKRKDLIDLGWPTALLRIAIVQIQGGRFHAVLLVRIDGTDYALDNLTSRVVPWIDTPYEYLMIQDRDDPSSWHDMRPNSAAMTSS